MKERAALQCMEETQTDSDTEGKYQSICAYIMESKKGSLLLLSGATRHKNIQGKLCFPSANARRLILKRLCPRLTSKSSSLKSSDAV